MFVSDNTQDTPNLCICGAAGVTGGVHGWRGGGGALDGEQAGAGPVVTKDEA